MATATKTPPAKSPAKKAEKGTLDYLELALENLNKAREHAQKDARGQIDSPSSGSARRQGRHRGDPQARPRAAEP